MDSSRSRLIRIAIAAVLAGTSAAAFAGRGGMAATREMPSVRGTGTAASMQRTAPTTTMRGARTTTSTTRSTTLRGPTRTGQPNQECGSATAPNTPGNAASAPGSAFNEDGKAGTVYAGEQPQNSRNIASVSQYDTACAHQH